jgi:endonuclease/exonuclease/phosphatase family metal-dependent hydrolase
MNRGLLGPLLQFKCHRRFAAIAWLLSTGTRTAWATRAAQAFKMSETSVILSPASLRQRRLAALERRSEIGGDNSSSSHSGTAITAGASLLSRASAETSAEHPSLVPKAAAAPVVASAVVDLCQDTSDEDEDDAASRTSWNLLDPPDEPPKKKVKSTPKKPPQSAKQISPTAPSLSHLTVATYNVWFGMQGDGNPHPDVRMQGVVDALANLPDIIGFQEVIPVYQKSLLQRLEQSGYTVFVQPFPSYGCALAVKQSPALTILDQGWLDFYMTHMSRGLLYVRASVLFRSKKSLVEHQVLFLTTHLESFCGPENNGARERSQQVLEMEAFVRDQFQTYSSLQTCIFTGDMNWDDESRNPTNRRLIKPDNQADGLLDPDAWIDAWMAVKSPDKGYTYDAKENAMLGGSLRRRFDRVLIRQRPPSTDAAAPIRPALIPTDAAIVGQEVLQPGLTFLKQAWSGNYPARKYPVVASDHFAVLVKLKPPR